MMRRYSPVSGLMTPGLTTSPRAVSESFQLRVERVIDGKGYDVLSMLDGSSTLWTVYHGAQAWQRTADSGDGWLFLSLTMHAAFTTIITEGSNG